MLYKIKKKLYLTTNSRDTKNKEGIIVYVHIVRSETYL